MTRVVRQLFWVLLGLCWWPTEAQAIRWTLGVASELVPVVLDAAREETGTPFRVGVRPVVEVELAPVFSLGVYAPFVVYRSGEGDGAASAGGESVFGLSASGRYPILRAEAPEEIFLYATARGGMGTFQARAGPFLGGAIGGSVTWLDTGRGLFAELDVGQLWVGQPDDSTVSRTTFGVTVGLVFRFGGGDWYLSGR